MTELAFYTQHSPFSWPGEYAALWDQVEPTISAMKAAITPLLFHYRGDGDYAENGIAAERVEEINLRYTTDMLTCVNNLAPIVPGEPRPANQRMVGCCRDWALLFVSLARHHGFAARSRVGFSNYFTEDWWIDHTIAEIWDTDEQRWRLVDPEMRDAWTTPSGQHFDPLDVSRTLFLPGLDAWREVRAGNLAPDPFVVSPEIEEENLRGIPYLWHNLVLDLAALNRYEMVLWDVWGIDLDEPSDAGAALLDEVAATTTLEQRQQFFARPEFAVAEPVLSFSPHAPDAPPAHVIVREVAIGE